MNQQINGSIAITRHATVGGQAHVRGNMNVTGNMRVEGWMDAPNVKTPCKGLYPDLEALERVYPRPHAGWWALVGDSIPAEIYRASGHRWIDTGTTGGDTVVDLTHYDEAIDEVRSQIQDFSDAVDNIQHPIGVEDTTLGDLVIADSHRTPILTVTAGGHIRTANFNSANIGPSATAPATTQAPATLMGVLRSMWSGKRAAVIGDSISAPSHIGGTTQCWWELLADIGLSATSYAVGGAELSHMVQQAQQVATAATTYDIILIMGGTNDFGHNKPLGELYTTAQTQTTVGDTTLTRQHRTNTTATNTTCGALNTILSTLKGALPDTPIAIITPPTAGLYHVGANIALDQSYANTLGLFFDQYIDTLRQAARHWSTHLIDVHSQAGFLMQSTAFDPYVASPGSDRLHPSLTGHAAIARIVLRHLLAIPPRPTTDTINQLY